MATQLKKPLLGRLMPRSMMMRLLGAVQASTLAVVVYKHAQVSFLLLVGAASRHLRDIHAHAVIRA